MKVLKELLKIALVFIILATGLCLQQWRRDVKADEERYKKGPISPFIKGRIYHEYFEARP